MLDLGKLYKRFDQAIAVQQKRVLQKSKSESIEDIRYNAGFLDGLVAARAAIETIVTEGGE